MPELPDVTVYIETLERRVAGETLTGIRLASPFVLRSVTPRPGDLAGLKVLGLRRIGKRIVFELDGDRYVVIHLMIAGRFRWNDTAGAKIPGRVGLAAFDFSSGTLIFTEAAKKKRASLYLVEGREELATHDPGGLEITNMEREEFVEALTQRNHTLKRALTDPRILSGIGNAYSDEILHRAKLSPVKQTSKLGDDEWTRLWDATRVILREWTDRLREEAGDGFPKKVTAFRPEMAVHGKYKEPCPVCGDPVQRIRYASNETNYCATCQTGGKLLADRALSRLLKKDWPRSLADMEEYKRERRLT